MNPAVRIRLVLLGLAILIVAGLTLQGVNTGWRRISDLEGRLSSDLLESFRLADEFQGRLLNLNNSMIRYSAGRELETWNEFHEASKQLDSWIDEYDSRLNNRSKLSTERERELFRMLNDDYVAYLGAAWAVRTNQQPPVVPGAGFTQLHEFDQQAQHLLSLGIQLGRAHREAEGMFLGAASRSLANLRSLLFGGVVLLLGLVGTLGVVIYRDMIAPLTTKLVLSEALLERQEKLATLGTLAAGIAHEIRNPLTSVKARLYTLGKHIKGNDAAAVDASIIGGEITRLERIVQDVLQFARPSEPKLQVMRADAPLREVQTLTASALERAGVDLKLEEGPELYARMDSGLIKQVLLNLIRNASEAIHEKGTITLRLRSGHAPLHGQTKPVAILEVADTGEGIPPEVEKRLFDPFFTTKETGTGLGLPIAARIVQKHDGLLQYHTHPGRGTTFGILLPVVPAPKTEPAPCLSHTAS